MKSSAKWSVSWKMIPYSPIYIPYPRVNCLKTIPFTAAHTYIATYMAIPPPPDSSFPRLKNLELILFLNTLLLYGTCPQNLLFESLFLWVFVNIFSCGSILDQQLLFDCKQLWPLELSEHYETGNHSKNQRLKNSMNESRAKFDVRDFDFRWSVLAVVFLKMCLVTMEIN